jgi:hypothetical protein
MCAEMCGLPRSHDSRRIEVDLTTRLLRRSRGELPGGRLLERVGPGQDAVDWRVRRRRIPDGVLAAASRGECGAGQGDQTEGRGERPEPGAG